MLTIVAFAGDFGNRGQSGIPALQFPARDLVSWYALIIPVCDPKEGNYPWQVMRLSYPPYVLR